MSQPTFVLAAGPFVDAEKVEPLFADAGVKVRVASLDAPESVAQATAGADGVVVVTNPLPRDLVEALAPSVKIIGRAGVGLDAIDLDAAVDRGLTVFHTPDYCVAEVATHAVALALAVNRRIVPGDAIVRRSWGDWRELTPVAPLHEQVVGVVGLGKIGRAVAACFAPLCAQVIGFDPWLESDLAGVKRAATLDELLSQADVITLHLPLTPKTDGFIGPRELAQVKSGAVLVNVSRGGLIDEAALADALRAGLLAGAGLDVLATEPPPADHPLLDAPNVVLSPHFAWYSTGSERRVWTMTIAGMLDLLAGGEASVGRVAAAPGAGVSR